MSPITTLRSGTSKANDLFARIADTTPGAIKTRESLFVELKAELELNARLEQDHLLPVLRKHAGTKVLADKVTQRLRDLRTLMARIEREPKEGDDFPGKVSELKTLFRAHLRDEKNELVPAIKKALSDEEAAAVSDKIEAAKAAAAKAAQDADDKRRADARRQREQAEARQAAADAAERAKKKAAADTARVAKAAADAAQAELDAVARAEKKAAADAARAVKAAAEASQAQVDAARQVVESGLRVVTDATQRAVAQMGEGVGNVGEQGRSLAVVAKTGTAIAGGVQGASREWMQWVQTRAQNQASGFVALMQCRTPQDVFAVQTRLMRQDMELLMQTGGRVSQIAAGAASNAASLLAR